MLGSHRCAHLTVHARRWLAYLPLFATLGAVTPLQAELVGYWPLDETEGETAVDVINGNDGFWQNPEGSLEWVPGRVGGGAKLTDAAGANNYFGIATIEQLLGAEGITIAAWVNLESQSSSGYNGIFMTRDFNGGNASWGVAVEGDHLDTRVNGPGIDSAAGTLTVEQGWIHVALVWDGAAGTHVQYVNGVESARAEDAFIGTIASTSGPWYIGYDNCCGDNRDLDGTLDDVAIWNEALDDAAIAQLASGISPNAAPPAELVGYWPLDALEGETAGDLINGNDGVWQSPEFGLEWVEGRVDGAAKLTDSGGTYFLIDSIPQLIGASGLTIAAWVDPDSQTSSNYNGIFMTRDFNGGNTSWGVAIEANHLDTRVEGPGIDSPADLLTPDAGWIHVALVWDGNAGTHIQYVNGQETARAEGAFTGSIVDTTGPWHIGYDNCCGDTRGFDGLIDEVAIWNGPLPPETIRQLAAAFSPDSLGDDLDGDGLPNKYEEGFAFLNPEDPSDAAADEDEDGLSNLVEFQNASDPSKADSDDDGLSDGDEVLVHQSNPIQADTDGDGLLDGDEVNVHMTNPILADTDEDAIQDGREIAMGTDPNDPTSPAPPEAGLIGAWTFDDGAGPVAKDSISANDGVWQNEDEADLEWVDGIIGGAAQLTDSGASSFFEIETISQLINFEGLTISVWIRPEEQSSSGYNGLLMTRSFNNGNTSWGVAYEGDHLDTRVQGPGIDSSEGSLPVTGEWYHVAMVWDGVEGTHTQYINGEESASGGGYQGKIVGTSGPWFLGYDPCCGNSRDFDGAMDDAAMWNIPLDAEAIREIYENGLAGISVVETSSLTITQIDAPAADDTVAIQWTSAPGRFYNIQRSTNLVAWENILTKVPAAAAPAEVTMASPAADLATAFYRVTQTDPPALLETSFEDGAADWTVALFNGFDATDTTWEVGTPTSGPGSARTGDAAFGIGLDGPYAEGTGVILRSPVIDPSGVSNLALTFWHYLDIVDGEGGQVSLLEEDGTLIQSLEPLFAETTLNTTEWTEISMRLPNLERPFRIEFQFLSGADADPNGAGWYIDDVRVGR